MIKEKNLTHKYIITYNLSLSRQTETQKDILI